MSASSSSSSSPASSSGSVFFQPSFASSSVDSSDAPRTGYLGRVVSVFSPSNSTISTLATGTSSATSTVMTNLGDVAMFSATTESVAALASNYGLSAGLGRFGAGVYMAVAGIPGIPGIAVSAGSFLTSKLITLICNGVRAISSGKKLEKVEGELQNLMKDLVKNRIKLEKCERNRLENREEIFYGKQTVISRIEELEAVIQSLKEAPTSSDNTELKFAHEQLEKERELLMSFDKELNELTAEKEKLEGEIVEKLGSLYTTMKARGEKLGDVIDKIQIKEHFNPKIDPTSLHQTLESHISRSAEIPEASEAYAILAEESALQLLEYWKIGATKQIYEGIPVAGLVVESPSEEISGSKPGSGGLYVDHYANRLPLKEIPKLPESGFFDRIKPLWSASNSTIGTASSAASSSVVAVTTNLAPQIMYNFTERAMINSATSYGLPAGLGKLAAFISMGAFGIPAMPIWVPAAAGFVASEVFTLGGNAIYLTYLSKQKREAELSVNQLMEKLIEADRYMKLEFPAFEAQSEMDIRQEIGKVREFQHVISQLYRELAGATESQDSAAIDRIKKELVVAGNALKNSEDACSMLRKKVTDKKSERESVELFLLGAIEGLYQAKKKSGKKQGDEVKKILDEIPGIDLSSINFRALRLEIQHLQSKQADSTDESEKAVYAKQIEEHSKVLLAHWKLNTVMKVFSE